MISLHRKRFSMVTSILLWVCMSCFSLNAQDKNIKWLTNYEQALQQAKSENKTILLSFSGSDWCLPCMKLKKELFEDAAFQKYAKEHFVLVMLDFPSKKKNALAAEQQAHNEALAEKYNTEGSFPRIVLLSKDEAVLGKKGYTKGGAATYINYFNNLIQ